MKTSANEKKFPLGWNDKYWKNGDGKIGGWLPDFRENSGFLIDIPDDADELFFFSHFINDEVLDNLVFEMNMLAGTLKNSQILVNLLQSHDFVYGLKMA